jgi:hypothetical protein
MSRFVVIVVLGLALAACASTDQPLAERTAIFSMHDFMTKVIDPAANAVFAAGNAEDASKVSAAQWKAALEGAGVLQESGRLLLVSPRSRPDPEWTRTAQLLVDAGADANAAAAAKDHNAAFEAGGKLYESCNGCHSKFVHGKT